jgi:hypothetical protein
MYKNVQKYKKIAIINNELKDSRLNKCNDSALLSPAVCVLET